MDRLSNVNKSQNQNICRLFYSHEKMQLLALFVLFTTEMTNHPALPFYVNSEIPTLSYTWSLKKVPLSGKASPYSLL